MKRYLKTLFPLIFLMVCLCCTTASAASVPGKVTGLKATSSDASIKLKWNKASKAKKYAVYRVDNNGGQEKLVKKTSSTSCTVKGTIGVTSYYKVCALNKSGKSGAFSSVIAVTPRVNAPKTPSNFYLKSRGSLYVTLKWSRVNNAGGYVIESYNKSTGSYDIIKTISSSKTKETSIKNLTENTTYKFRIRSLRKVNGSVIYSSPSDVITVKAVKFSSTVKSVRAPYYTVKVKKTVNASNLSGGSKITLKAGTKLVVKSKHGSKVKGYTSDGSAIQVKRSFLKYTGLDSRGSDYSTEVKEQFINSTGLGSRTKYFIWISQYTYRTNIFKGSAGNWKLVGSYPCIVGSWNSRTSSGMHRILKKNGSGQYGGPVITFTPGTGTSSNPNGNAFHNFVNSSRVGAKSHGCVRVNRSVLNYIYSHCPVGTSVYIY